MKLRDNTNPLVSIVKIDNTGPRLPTKNCFLVPRGKKSNDLEVDDVTRTVFLT